MSSLECPKCGATTAPEAAQCESCGHLLARARPEGVAGYLENMGPGTLVKNTYSVIEFVGEGGAGAVYVGEHVRLGHLVAIKALYPNYVRDEDMRRRFLEEAVIQANLNHPNIARVSDVVDDGTHCAIIMEFIDGSSLDKYLATTDSFLDTEDAARLFIQVLDGMSYAHAQGVVHRDIKPGNVLLAEGSTGMVPKVTDFGIAKVLSQHRRTETGTAMGTIYYAAPEQLADAKSVDHRADVYSLGCTFYEMLTLKLPFEAESMFGVMKKHLQAPRPDPRHINQDIPADLAAAIMRAMAVEPKHRYQSCAEFAEEVRQCLSIPPAETSSSVLAAQPPPNDRTGGARPRSRDSGAARSVSGLSNVLETMPAATDASTPRGAIRPTSPARTTARSSQPPRTLRKMDPRPGGANSSNWRPPPGARNPVSLVLWGLIALLAGGLTLVALFRGDRASDVEPPERGTMADASIDSSAPTPIADQPDDDAAPPESSGTMQALDLLEGCRQLATDYLEFDTFGTLTIHEVIEDLESRQASCEEVMLAAAAGSAFDTIVASLNATQTRAVLSELRARRARGRLEEYCPDLLTAVTDLHRGLRRIYDAGANPELMAYEVTSLLPRKAVLTRLYASHLRDYPDCPIAPIPQEFLAAEVMDAAPELVTPVREGSGE